VSKYAGRVSGPLLDRFDLRVRVERPSVDHLLGNMRGEPTVIIAERVAAARARASDRQGVLNAGLAPVDLDTHAPLESEALEALRFEMEKGRLSARGYHRIRRVARTIADLAPVETERIDEATVALALEMRTSVRRSLTSIGRVA
jgi:magnesium chelatase family protein